ncbi:hypothetical protein [Glaciibacter psychrotolerans]|uniref:Uncharacterized protein n=1 Tax=Glaciibacter psychrotolerans TaxID=670054 RepID=A0A7Z0EBD4_9MICO|nr:hypothetical protein [Leifsonia psychrotolerans]NYJ18480.1 hypothetical protein [Leifsonia psychrotolerans]
MTENVSASGTHAAGAVVHGVNERLPPEYFTVYEGSLLYSSDDSPGIFAVVLVGIQHGLLAVPFAIPDDTSVAIEATVEVVVRQLLPMSPPRAVSSS